MPRQFTSLHVLIPALLVSLLTACGGGGSGGGADSGTDDPAPGGGTDEPVTYRVSGQVQKGPFTQLTVQVRSLDPVTGDTGESIDAVVDGSSYQVDVPEGDLYVVEARGEFTNEATGDPIQVSQPLQALAPLEEQDRTTHLNVASHFSADRFLQAPKDPETGWQDRITQNNQFVSKALGLPDNTDPTQVELSAVGSDAQLGDASLSLLLMSGALGDRLSGDRLFGPELINLVERFRSATDPLELKQDLDLFAGLDAADLYRRIRNHVPEWSLPEISLPDTPIWFCEIGQPCDWVSQPDPMLSVASTALFEAQGEARVTLSLSRALDQDATVRVSTAEGTARAEQDFRPTQQDLVFPAGETQRTLAIPVVVDNRNETTEAFQLIFEAVSDNYQLARPDVSVTLLNGAPDDLANQTPTEVALVSACIRQIGTPTDLDLTTCELDASVLTTVSAAEDDAASVQVDLAVQCGADEACPDQGNDWLVEFALLAQDGEDVVVEEVMLGRYIYPGQSLQRQSEAVVLSELLVSLSANATRLFLVESRNAGHSLAFEARLVGADEQLSRQALPDMVAMPDRIIAGDQTLIPAEDMVLVDGSSQGCPEGHYGLDGDFELNTDSTVTGSVCVDLSVTDGDTVTAHLSDGTLDLQGAVLPLPDGLVALIGTAESELLPFGASELQIFGSADSTTDPVQQSMWLHQQGMPVRFRVSHGQITPTGLDIGYDQVRYLMDPGYSAQDPRAGGTVVSNDILYKQPGPGTGTLTWGDAGLTVDLTLAEHSGGSDGPVGTVFPRGEMLWESIDIQYVNGQFTAPEPVNLDFYLVQAGGCREADCKIERQRAYHVNGAVKLDDRGFMQGETQYQPFEISDTTYILDPAWGAREGAEGEDRNSFARPNDLAANSPVMLALAGYRFPANRDRASDFLVAHIEPATGQTRNGIHPLGSAAERNGNQFPTGLSLGPQIYRDANGQPSLGGGQWLDTKPLDIDNGNDQLSLPASRGTKYTIRNGGITGVFNIDSSALEDPLPFYGYDLALDRFAIRVVDNEVDEENWLDGHTSIAGDAGLDVHFENLTLDCAGRFGQAEVVYESCDQADNNGNGYVDENCGQQLASWRADTDVFGMSFDDAGGDNACSIGTQQLRLQQQVNFEALNKPIGLDSAWTPDGEMGDQLLALLDDYRMDAVEDESEGFPLVPSAGRFDVVDLTNDTGTRYGSFDITPGLIAVPFWESIEGDVRIANWLSDQTRDADPNVFLPMAEPSVVLPENAWTDTFAAKRNGPLFSQDILNSENENLNLFARYPWGNTGFEFKLPVYYYPHQLNTAGVPKFMGRRLSTDLFVMEAGAGINYIEPDRTKMSFGASADFERLQELNVQIDLNNPDNLAQVDQWLESLGLISGPVLKPALEQVMEPVSVLNRYANKGLDSAMREGLLLAVEQAESATSGLMPNGQSPIVAISEGLAQVKNFPHQLAVVLDDQVKAPIDNSLNSLETELRDQWLTLETDLVNASIDTQVNLSSTTDAMETLASMREQIETVNRSLSEPVDALHDLIDDLATPISRLDTATRSLDQKLTETLDVTSQQCTESTYGDPDNYGYLGEMVTNLNAVQSLLSVVEGNEVLEPLLILVASDPAVQQRLRDAQQSVRRQAEELDSYLQQARTAIQNQVCGDQMQDLVASVKQVLTGIRTQTANLETQLATIKSHLGTIEQMQDKLVAKVLTPIKQVEEAIGSIDNQLRNGFVGADPEMTVMDQMDQEIAELTNGQIDAFVAANGETDLLGLVFETAENELDAQYQSMRNQLISSAQVHLPGAYYSPEQLRQMLVTKLMDTPPVADVRTALNQHLREINKQVNDIALQVTDQANQAVREAIKIVETEANEALAAAKSVVRDLPLKGGELDGYAVIAGDELERAHIGAEWAMAAAEEGEDPNTFSAALDAVSWDADNKVAGCSIPEGQSRLDVTISGYSVPANIAASELTIEKVYLGFTLASGTDYALAPKGVFGGIDTLGDIGFSEFVIYDPALAAGIGDKETYLGARAGALFSEVQAEVAFLVGRTCNQDILLELDPKVAQFIDLPDSGFAGGYARGSASFPVITTGCPLTVGVGADFGAWVLVGDPTTLGGLVGGGAYGKVACVGALRGQVRAIGQVNTDGDMSFVGEGFGVAGVGSCEPASWTSVSRSRNDSWCATGDARFQAGYQDGWSVFDLDVSAIH
ncbi:Calx-beta domain-containing protein [Saccharospirillum impatiens]|uniref:Calx-beta domain-containing protein n=1 Tax=Saccharospirillum impatiens TaxID=169438 RepID=UPI00041990B8|nr:Calx-beta domain-containing protein [Saccharospirillum impatiens]